MQTQLHRQDIEFRPISEGLQPSEDRSQFIEERLQQGRDVFIVPCLDGHLIYNPHFGRLALIDSATKDALDGFLGNPESTPTPSVAELLETGLFELLTDDVPNPLPEQWAPTSVTFSTTQKCTLRCRYCYADGGRLEDLDISLPVARTALDLIMENAERQGKQPAMSFLGEGEATASWQEFTDIIEYFRGKCSERGMTGSVTLHTNGVYPARRAPFIAEQCDTVIFSLDGLSRSHDRNRVLPNGKGSFALVMENLHGLEALGVDVQVRSTISQAALPELIEYVRFLGENTKVKQLHFEPVFDNSTVMRQARDVGGLPSEAFVAAFRKARLLASEYGIELYYSGSDVRQRDSFCGVGNARNFVVTSRGLVTSCNEVLQPWDKRAGVFQYGAWDEKQQRFVFDEDRLRALFGINVRAMRKCTGCFAKFNCAGDCYAKNATISGDPLSEVYTDRCYIARNLLRDNLVMALAASEAQGRGGAEDQNVAERFAQSDAAPVSG